jgi:hypothetical protein
MSKRARPDEAAVCYNMGYRITKPNQVRELSSVRFKSGVLNTDYDCFLMAGPDNAFYSEGDGGYINVSHHHEMLEHISILTQDSLPSSLPPTASSTALPQTSPAHRQLSKIMKLASDVVMGMC